jgi:hypothetical protein
VAVPRGESVSSAYHKAVEADNALAQGRLEDARSLMAEAAAIDPTYALRAELIGREDGRKIAVRRTVRKTVVPFLAEHGFVDAGDKWCTGARVMRSHGETYDEVALVGGKFGKILAVEGSLWWTDRRKGAEHFNWSSVGLRGGAFAYATQLELEAVCSRWRVLIAEHLLPWFAARR